MPKKSIPVAAEIGAAAFFAPWHAPEFSGWRIVLLRHFVTQNAQTAIQIVICNGPRTVFAEGWDDAETWRQLGKSLQQEQ